MKATTCAGALLFAALAASTAAASDYWYPMSRPQYPVAPVACAPGFYSNSPGGMVYGPNYLPQQPGVPFTMGTPMNVGSAPTPWPTNPYMRGPRDFFMWRENMEDQMRRNVRPVLVP